MSVAAAFEILLEGKETPETAKVVRDELLQIARTGESRVEWKLLKPALKREILKAMAELSGSSENNDEMIQRLVSSLDEFANPPFTIQRCCELLTIHRKLYSSQKKLVLALERNLRVFSAADAFTVDPMESESGALVQELNATIEKEANARKQQASASGAPIDEVAAVMLPA